MPKALDSKPYALLLSAVVLFSLFAGTGSVPLFDEDEGAYAEVTREMLDSGDFLTPHLNGVPFFHKPPVIYWVQAVSVSLLGLNEFALRLPCALASLAWALMLFRFARRRFNPAVAWYAVFFMVTSIQTGIVSKAGLADAFLNLFVTLAMFAIYAYYRRRRRRDIYLAFGWTALGVLSKGPIAAVIPLACSGFFFGLKGKWGAWVKAIFSPVGWCLFLIMALPWYVTVYRVHGADFIGEIFFTHNIARFKTAFEGHSGSLFFYIPVILAGMIPHTAFVIKAAAGIRSLLQDELNQYLLIWFLFVLLFFSLAGTKLHHYILCGYVPLFLFMAQATGDLRHFYNQLIWPLGFVAVLLFLPLIAAGVQPYIKDEFARLVIDGALASFAWDYYLVTGAAVGALLGLFFFKTLSTAARTAAAGIIVLAVVNLHAVPVAGDILQQPIKEAALIARQKGYRVHMWQMSCHSFGVYRQGLVEKGEPQGGDIVITRQNKLKAVKRYQVLYEKNGIVLARIEEI